MTAQSKPNKSAQKSREARHAKAFHDLNFLKAMRPRHRSKCINLLDKSRAQLRQDLFALTQHEFKRDGFFLEFGATNGIDISNTYLLEKRFGWTGILAEPAQIWHRDLKANRDCRIDTRCVWKSSGEVLSFTQAVDGVYSGISDFVAGEDRAITDEKYDVETISLNDLLSDLNAPNLIDYASIDTEGSEFDILNAVDFDRWSFRVLTVEHNRQPQREKIYDLLSTKGYSRVFEGISRYDDWYVLGD